MSPTDQPRDFAAGNPAAAGHGHGPDSLRKMALAAMGIVFGDIGTSPIYAFRETFAGHHPLAPDALHIYGVLSLIFWSMMIVVTIKYVSIIMRADNKGQGGSLALLALVNRRSGRKRWTGPIVILGVFATALFYGDSMITPAMSVLSASEGLITVNAHFAPLVLPISVAILIGLFAIQSRGTARVGQLFGPIMLVYFATLAGLGIMHIATDPAILLALNPWYAFQFFLTDKLLAFLALGSVVLAVTGAEALYADMGHFGRNPIRVSWLFFVLPGLMLNYLGQGAFILSLPADQVDHAIRNPFFLLAPENFRLPLVILAIVATIIASQAVITGAFSLTQQAIQLGFIPRLKIKHTSASAQGQIYIPVINWGLMVMVILLVLSFRSSSNLAAAYGIAVTGAMFIDTCLLAVLLLSLWKWNRLLAYGALAIFFIVDIAYFGANLTKVPDGGWFPLLVGLVIFTMLTTWAKGRGLMVDRLSEAAMPIPVFVASAANSAVRVQGTAVFMTSTSDGVPHALLHNLKHNKVLHERVVLLTVKVLDVPTVDASYRYQVEDLGRGFYRVLIHYGFMEEADVPAALAMVEGCGQPFRMIETSFFLTRQTLLPAARPGMPIWREKLFAWMLRNAESPMEFFRLPTNRVIELGSQLEI
ncbi:KUP system potassium uptake protein [Sphingobium sp. B2D3A]|uniref:potassium transporter Kup n=1 Tax=unclassified Sphingobium TaxID=2611147 RepID=UPI002225AB49|nr:MULTISPECIES: potassium transporter Kup [unclassified Sphingobium]MCW2337353.1 KUP system potassium uptake protein [Sphingobium sp. B2D3A]MCW2350990.1 KUP system potassium uptake protein [Sphingobium sp. B12D2B]MCW2365750.1 KUP system potassium uptake protein [Sphingobium sp. B7D2B]MCW2370153.1 KUP system potassium uptake protein [Sphingobium sp. B11D3D]MCW2383811.1 KUP system potassium uptake protein [Sphingobium sp. B2D3D]